MDNKKNVLGRGLDTLLPTSRSAVAVAPHPTAMTGDLVKEIPVEQIDRNPYQTRTRFAEEAMNELAASIKASGVVQPGVIRQVSNEQGMEMTIVENLQREDLNPMEQAKAYDRLGREFGLTQEQMAQRT